MAKVAVPEAQEMSVATSSPILGVRLVTSCSDSPGTISNQK